MKPVPETPNFKGMQGKHARGEVKAKVFFQAEENFVSDNVDFDATETQLSIFAYTGPETEPEFYIIFELKQQNVASDVVIDDKLNRAYVYKRGHTVGGYARSGTIRNLVTTRTSAKADSFSFEGVDWAQRKFSVTGEAFEINEIVPT